MAEAAAQTAAVAAAACMPTCGTRGCRRFSSRRRRQRRGCAAQAHVRWAVDERDLCVELSS
eukprot:125287-Chlamydomonas_euryale.AAC.1